MQNTLTVAKILKPQGIRGEVKVAAYTDSPEDLKALVKVYIGGNAHKLLKVRPVGGDCAVIALSGVADRNAAETLRGQEICALREDAPPLPEGRYYIGDVVGCTLVNLQGEELGVVTQITPYNTDVYDYETPQGKKISFAAVKGVIAAVDVENRRVTVDGEKLAEVSVEN